MRLAIGIGIVALLFIAACTSYPSFEDKTITVFKSSSCGCCAGWANNVDSSGLSVNVVEMADLSDIKREHEIPRALESCHTAVIEGYFVEGHVPMEAVDKLLTERPDIKGIALPGMPSGTPGMPGPKNGEWVIYAVNNDGSYDEFMRI